MEEIEIALYGGIRWRCGVFRMGASEYVKRMRRSLSDLEQHWLTRRLPAAGVAPRQPRGLVDGRATTRF
uniref:Transposase n=1 Tax=Bursaphelenchus xylophilus TaxID=6326 RepID=A0A1I7SG16_BURXY